MGEGLGEALGLARSAVSLLGGVGASFFMRLLVDLSKDLTAKAQQALFRSIAEKMPAKNAREKKENKQLLSLLSKFIKRWRTGGGIRPEPMATIEDAQEQPAEIEDAQQLQAEEPKPKEFDKKEFAKGVLIAGTSALAAGLIGQAVTSSRTQRLRRADSQISMIKRMHKARLRNESLKRLGITPQVIANPPVGSAIEF